MMEFKSVFPDYFSCTEFFQVNNPPCPTLIAGILVFFNRNSHHLYHREPDDRFIVRWFYFFGNTDAQSGQRY